METIRHALDSQACYVCGPANGQGLRLNFQSEDNRVVVSFRPAAAQQGWPGFVHPGIIMAILDETIARAATLADAYVMTGRIEFRFRQPAPLDQELSFTGSLVADHGRALELEGFVQLPDGSLVAEGRGLYMRLSDELRAALEQQVGAGS